MSPKKTAQSVKALREAEKAVEKARTAHRAAFRKALASLFNEYGLKLEAEGTQGAQLAIETVHREFKVEELPEEKWDQLLGILLTSPFLLAKYAWPALRESGRGRFVAIASARLAALFRTLLR